MADIVRVELTYTGSPINRVRAARAQASEVQPLGRLLWT